ncbi:MAG: hypothetical protein IJ784_01340 [Ruminiclostridium sp.]|uniref:hypothetical protein n=1 Tax=Ruminococcus sp. TaxID=41978 RepID=UPI0025E61F90|nr:hypothetical protein [Ruminococcus sp.]MBR1433033.1 hypothetical protein [Ruminococcus sp.]MBR1831060.1 hypothetical protein [Ruminiclostridium sp.]
MASNSGWISLHRKILDWEWYSNLYTRALFFHLLIIAAWKPTVKKGIELQRGQCLASLKELELGCSLSTQQLRTAIKHLETTQEITQSQVGKYRVITLNNYNKYQDSNTNSNTDIAQSPTQNQHNDQHESNTDTIYNNYNNSTNFNNCNNSITEAAGRVREENNSHSLFIPPTYEQVRQYCEEKGYENLDEERFVDWYESNGWEMANGRHITDWKERVDYWVRNEWE